MVANIRQLHSSQVVLGNRTRQLVDLLEEGSQDLNLIQKIKPQRVGVLECSVFDEYQSFDLRTQDGLVELGTYFEQSGNGGDFIMQRLRSYVTEQGCEPQVLLQMAAFPRPIPFRNMDEPLDKKTDSVYVVNNEWLRPEEFADYIGK